MVIPAELFQVDYAAEARQFLSTYLDRPEEIGGILDEILCS